MAGKTHPEQVAADVAGIARAVEVLRQGGLVAVPTETVYGLAARADRADAVAAIYRAKGRPDFNPLIVHVPDAAAAERLALFDERAHLLAHAFWPGALTMVLPRRENAPVAEAVTAGLSTIALRCPAHPAMRDLLAAADIPLAAPSANRSGGVSPTTAAHVVASLGANVDLIVDGGACAAGIESTIVALRLDGGWQILRPGPITTTQISVILGEGTLSATSNGGIEAPGQLASHYAPGKPMRLGVTNPYIAEFHIGFGAVEGDINLSASADLAEAAANLYAVLHAAADSSKPAIAVAPVPDSGIGVAINDRLRRAAA